MRLHPPPELPGIVVGYEALLLREGPAQGKERTGLALSSRPHVGEDLTFQSGDYEEPTPVQLDRRPHSLGFEISKLLLHRGEGVKHELSDSPNEQLGQS